MKTIRKNTIRALALLLALICVVGIMPLTASAAPSTVKLADCDFHPISYTSNVLGKCSLHEMYFNYDGENLVGFCADHGKGMGTSLIGQNWSRTGEITNAAVKGMMAYYYCHTLGIFTDECKSLGLNTVWNDYLATHMNALTQAVIWRYETGNFTDPEAAAAEEWMYIVNSIEGSHYTDIDQQHDGMTFRQEMAYILNMAEQGVWGNCEVYEYRFSGAGSSSHPADTVQRAVVGRLTVESIVNEAYNLVVRKVDSANTNVGLPGAKFHIESANGSYKNDVITGADGTATITELPAGTYSVTETGAPEGYTIDSTAPQYIAIPGDSTTTTVTVTFMDTKEVTGSGSIRKVDADDPAKGLPGAVIKIEGIDNAFTGTYTTGSGGYLTDVPWENMPVGSYKATEITPPNGYTLSNDPDKVTQTFRWDGTTDVTLTFEDYAKVVVELVKLNESGAALPGAVFNVLKDGRLVTSAVTDANGKILVTDVTEGLYTFAEVSAPDGYARMDEPVLVYVDNSVVTNGGTVTVTAKNEKLPDLTVKKLDKETGAGISGTVFEVKGICNGYVTNVTTGADGTVRLTGIPEGSYEVTEKSVPSPYILDTNNTKTLCLKAGESSTLVFENSKKPGIIIKKYDAQTMEPLSDAIFRVTKVEDGTVSYDRVTNNSGEIVLTDLDTGVYSVKEISAPAGYIADNSEYHVELFPDKTSTLTVTNERRPDLRIVKYDAQTMKPIPDTAFEVYRDAVFLGRYATDENGEISLCDLVPGTYLVKEVAPADGYVVNSTPQEIELEAGATETYNLVFLNKLKPGIRLIKLDSQTMEPLANAKFRITEIGGNYSREFTTGASGEINLTSLTPGSYTVEELTAPDGYLIDDAARTIKINGGENAQFVFTDTKKPSLKLVKLDSLTGDRLPGAAFRIARIEDGTRYLDRITDTSGEINISDLLPGVYSVSELSAPEGYIPNGMEYHMELIPGRTAELVLSNDRKPDLKIVKKDADTGETLSGAVFTVKKADGETITTETTDANGEIFLRRLEPGVYEITEKTPPVGYLPAEEPTQFITLKANKLGEVIFENHVKPGITINKLDSITGDGIKGAKFHITYASNNTFTGEINDLGDYLTDENGQIVLSRLKDGWYRVTEIAPAAGYAIKEPAVQEFFLKAGTSKEITFENVPLSALIVFKYDSVTGEAVKNAVFQVKYLSGTSGTGGTVIGTYKTSMNGSFTVTGLKAGTYIVEELTSDSGHVIDTAPQTAYLSGKDQDVVELYFGNAPKGGLLVKKVDASNGKPLSGVEFMVTTSDGTVVGDANGKFVTDSAGTFTVDGLNPGTSLVVKETRAKEGYVLDDAAQTVTIKAGKTVSLEFRNAPKGSLIIVKKDAVTGAALAGVTFKVTSSDGRFVANNGGKVSSNGLYYTDENGQIIITGLTPDTYVVTEVKALPGYVKDSMPQTVVVDPDDTQTLTFTNIPEGGLLIIKSDEDTGERIPGVKFEVRKMNGEVIGTYTTDRNGVISLPELTRGWYTVTELKAASGYKLDATPQRVEVKDGQTAALELTNVKVSGIAIHKTDAVTGKGIYGVKFMVYDGHNKPIEQLVTDQDGYAATETELTAGKYILREIDPAAGYLPDTQEKTVWVSAGRITTVEWKNEPITGQIQITKFAAEYNPVTGQAAGSTLKGAVYEITQERSGAVIGYITTDARGVAASEPLSMGRYVIREVTAPAYWKLSTQQFDVTLEYPGQIIRLADYDRAAILGVSITKSGIKEVLAGSGMMYRFTVANTSNVDLESFFWHDTLPYDVTSAGYITTGTYSHRLNYRVLYKTNCNDYRVLASNLLTTNNYALNLNGIALQSGEVITDIYYDFGTVPAGFQSMTQPTLTVNVSPTATDGYYVINRADVGGKYFDTWETATAGWVTIVRNLTKVTPLPKTGY